MPVCDARACNALAARWDELAGEIPFRSHAWMLHWWEHYRDDRSELLILAALDNRDQIVGIAPFYLQRSRREGRVLRFLGSGEVCSDYLSLLAVPELTEEVTTGFAEWLAQAAHRWDLIDLTGIEEGDRAIAAFARELSAHGHQVNQQADTHCWRSQLGSDWNQFLATLSKSRRERTRALLRRAAQSDRAVVHEVRTPEQLERAFPILIELHQKRRQSLGQPGCFASARFTAFHRDVALAMLDSGRLRLLWVEWEGRPMSVEYSFVGGETIFYYQGGFEPQLADERPGWLCFALSMKRAIEQGYRAFDFLRGDESYKASWHAEARPLTHLRIVGRQTSARVRFATWQTVSGMKGWARRILRRGAVTR